MFDIDSLIPLMFIFARLTGCILLNPIFGRQNLPSIFKVALVVLLTLVMSISVEGPITAPTSMVGMIMTFAIEIAFGYVLGFVISLFTTIMILGGELIDFQMGLSMAKIYDVQSNVSMALSATYYNILFILTFFAVNGHLTLISFFLTSDDIVPFGQITLGPELSLAIIDLFSLIIVLSIKLALPILAMEFLFEMGVGILMKMIPQINIFVINIQLKVFIGLISMYVFLAPAATFLEDVMFSMFDSLKVMMGLM